MDAIFIGIVRSEHPLEIKRGVISRIVSASKYHSPFQVSESILKNCYNILVGYECHHDSAVQVEHEKMARDVFSSWMRNDIQASISFLSGELQRASPLSAMTRSFKLKHLEIMAIAMNLIAFKDLDAISVKKPVMGYLVSAFLEEEDLQVACKIAILLSDYIDLVMCCTMDKENTLNCMVIKAISLVSYAEFSTSEIDAPVLTSNHVQERIFDLSSFFQKCLALLPSAKEAGMRKILEVISNSDKNPSVAVASFVQHLSEKYLDATLTCVVGKSEVSNRQLSFALNRMLDWLTWPGGVNVDSWIIVFIKCLVKAKKINVFMPVVEDKIMQVMKCISYPWCRAPAVAVFTFILISYLHSPELFHQTCPSMKDLVEKLKAEGSESSLHALQVLVELTFTLMYNFPGFPEVYGPVLGAIQDLKKPSEQQMKDWLERSLSAQRQEYSPRDIRFSLPKSETGKAGLINLGNTCYVNSVIQALFMLPSLRSRILSSSYSAIDQPVSFHLQRLFAFLSATQRPAISPSGFYKCSRPPWFREYAQQDCSEFLKYMLDKLEQESLSSSTPRSSSPCSCAQTSGGWCSKIPHEFFHGELEVTVECLHCHSFSRRTEIFNDLPLSFPDLSGSVAKSEGFTLKGGDVSDNKRSIIHTGIVAPAQDQESSPRMEGSSLTVESDPSPAPTSHLQTRTERFPMADLIHSYFSPELLQGSNQYHCDACRALQDARKTMQIVTAPVYLTLTLKRFTYDVQSQVRSKVLQDLYYPLTLEIATAPRALFEFAEKPCSCSDGVDTACSCLSSKSARKRSHSSSENRKLLCSDTSSSIATTRYHLVSVIVHSGMSSESGHYYCFTRDRVLQSESFLDECAGSSKDSLLNDKYKWLLFNDSRVTASSEEAFSSLCKTFPRDTPYVLIYQQASCDRSVDKEELPAHLAACVASDNQAYFQELQREQVHHKSRQSPDHQKKDDDNDGGSGSGWSGSCSGSLVGGSFDNNSRFIY